MDDRFFTITVAFAVYLFIIAVVGFKAYRKTRNSSDYFLGGQSWPGVPLFPTAPDMSGWLLFGLSGYAFASGMEAAWLAGACFGVLTNWLITARRSPHHPNGCPDAAGIPVAAI